jgi:glutathione synthase/RimK-type ligase-like ATP-grasp enzyme
MSRQGFVVVMEGSRIPVLDERSALAADEYLAGDGDPLPAEVEIVNLCRSYQYLSKGYYVSLLAEAREHRVLPSLKAIEELRNPVTVLRRLREVGVPVADARTVREARRAAVTRSAAIGAPLHAPALALAVGGPALAGADAATHADCGYAEVHCVLGKTVDARFGAACAAVFDAFEFPLLEVRFVRDGAQWKVGQVAPAAPGQLDADGMALLAAELRRARIAAPPRRTARPQPDRIACLWDAQDRLAASDCDTLDAFARVAARRGLVFEQIGRDDLPRLAEYDALFIRTVTAIDHYSFAFAQAAERLGMPVIDDPQSILKCSNKVFMHELFRRHGVPTPRTLTLSRRTPLAAVRALGFPVILKLPDGTFSQAVKKADSLVQLEAIACEMFRHSPLVVAQEFVPTEFDWRIGVLENRILFACKYHMADGHWQIVAVADDGDRDFGRVEALPIDAVPEPVRHLALDSTALVGDGLYGVDVKDGPGGPIMIEINDNPNIQTGYEDEVEKDRVYEEILAAFVTRIHSRAGSRGHA